VEPRQRIAHVIDVLDFGGVENMALLLLQRLPREQFEHHLLYTGVGQPARRTEFENAAQSFTTLPFRRGRWLSFIWRCYRYLWANGINTVLIHNFGHHPWIGLAARLAGIKQVYTIVASSPSVTPRARRKNWLKAQLGRLWCRLEVAVSPQVAAELENDLRLPPRRLRTIINCCMTDEIAARAARRRAYRQTTPPTILMVARLDDAKDHATLIHAVGDLLKRGKPVRLRLAGEGPLLDDLKILTTQLHLSEHVEFLGARHDIPELLGDSDLFVLATKTEGFGIVLIEAMSAELPVISSDVPACREVLEDGRCGLLVQVGDAPALAQAIARLLDDAELRARFIQAGLERVRKDYDPQGTIQAYARLLTGVLD
jgi:glycosyltransferase involved in cell wall biosynthesis